jgi:argininosuccinate lyase
LQPLNFAAVRDSIRAVSLLGHALGAAEFNLDLLRERSGANFITVTELADTIVRRDGVPFSMAHAIVAACVKQATEADGEITHEILQQAAEAALGRVLSLTAEDLGMALSAEKFVSTRTIYGGPAADETRSALEQQREAGRADREWMAGVRSGLQQADQLRCDAVRANL